MSETPASRWRPLAVAGLLVALVVAAIDARLINLDILRDLDPHPDSPEYAFAARLMFEEGYFGLRVNGEFVPSTYGWGFATLIVPFYALAGVDYARAVYVVVACSALGIVLVFGIARALFGPWAGLVAAACVATSGIDILLSSYVLSEVPGSLMIVAALAAAVAGGMRAAAGRPRAGVLFALSGAIMGYAFWIRLPNLLFVPLLALLVAFMARRPDAPRDIRPMARGFVLFAAGWLVMMVPVLVYNTAQFGSPLRTGYNFWIDTRYGNISSVVNVGAFSRRWATYFASLLGAPGPTFARIPAALAAVPFIVLAGLYIAALIGAPAARLLVRARRARADAKLGVSTAAPAVGVSAALGTLGLFAFYAVYNAMPDLRFMHTAAPLIALLGAGGFGAVTSRLGGRAHPALPAGAAALIVALAVLALLNTDNNRVVQAPLRYVHARTFAEKAEPDAVLITDEVEAVFFSSLQPRAASHTLVFLRRPRLQTAGRFAIASLAQDTELLPSLLRQGRPVYFVGVWDGTLEQFGALPELSPYRLDLAFDTPVNPYVSSRIYRVSLPSP